MGRKRRITTIEDEAPVDQQAPPPVAADEDQLDSDVATFFGQFGAEASRVKLLRVEHAGKLAYVGTYSPGEVNEEMIKESCGPGQYKVQLQDAQGRYVTSKMIYIDGSRQLWEMTRAQAYAAGAAPAAKTDNGNQLEFLRDQLNRQHEMILKMIEQKNGAQSPGMSEIIPVVTQLLDRLKPADPAGSIRNVMEAFSKGIEVAGAAIGGEDAKMTWLKVIERAAEMIPKTVEHLQLARNGQPAAAPADPLAAAKQGIAYLKTKAIAGKDVDLYIDLLGDNLDDPSWRPLVEQLYRPYDEIAKTLDAELLNEPYRTWFSALRDGILGELQSLSDRERPAGDNTDARKDG
jgi:hypothetical protein